MRITVFYLMTLPFKLIFLVSLIYAEYLGPTSQKYNTPPPKKEDFLLLLSLFSLLLFLCAFISIICFHLTAFVTPVVGLHMYLFVVLSNSLRERPCCYSASATAKTKSASATFYARFETSGH